MPQKHCILTEGEVRKIVYFLTGHQGYSIDGDYAKKMAECLNNNKVPLKYFTMPQNIQRFPELKELQRIHEEKYYNWRKSYDAVQKRFQEEKIKAVLIKSAGHFPYESDNLDVLIYKSDLQKVRDILTKEFNFIELKNLKEPNKYLFRSFELLKPTLPLHIHTKIEWINSFHNEKLVLERARLSHEGWFYSPSPEDSFLILTAHWYYEDKEFKLKEFLFIYELLHKDLNWEYIFKWAKIYGWRDGLLMAFHIYKSFESLIFGKSLIPKNILLKNLHYPEKIYYSHIKKRNLFLPFYLNKFVIKIFHLIKTLREKNNFFLKLSEVIQITIASIRVILKRHPQKFFIVSISGPDGVGKTTTINNICKVLDTCGLRVSFGWFRLGSTIWLKLFFILKKYNSKHQYKQYSIEGDKTFGKIKGILLLINLIFEINLRLLTAYLQKNLFISDRFIYDSLVDLVLKYNLSLDSKLLSIAVRMVPKPHLSFYLYTTQEKLHKRQEKTEIFAPQDQLKLYEKIAKKFNLIPIDASNSPDGVSSEIFQLILKKYFLIGNRK